METHHGPYVTFTSDQQTKLQELIDQAFCKGLKKAAREAEAEIDRLKARIAELEASKNKFSFWRKS